jgi:hypothetical protein
MATGMGMVAQLNALEGLFDEALAQGSQGLRTSLG